MVQESISHDRIPPTAAQVIGTKMIIAANEINFDLKIAINDQLFSDRVVLERCDPHHHSVNSTDQGLLSKLDRIGRIELIAVVDCTILAVFQWTVFGFQGNAGCRSKFYVVIGFRAAGNDTKLSLRSLGNG